MLSLAFSRPPPPPPLAPFHAQKHNSSILTIYQSLSSVSPTRNSIFVSSDLFKPRNLNLAFPSHTFVGELDDEEEEDEEEEEEINNIALLKESLKPELMPKHVALFADGHRRWAKEKNLSFEVGYLAFKKPLEQLFDLCRQLQIPVVSIFTLSTGNHALRPKEQVDFSMKYLEAGLDYYVTKMCMRDNIRFSVIGNTEVFPKSAQESIKRAEETTKNNKGLHIVSAFNYDGRYDITQACKSLADKSKKGLIQPQDVDEKIFQQQLQTNNIAYPSPDLFIRTGGKKRLSNYMLWQMAYSEMVFLEKYHPDMREADYVRIFSDFQKRGRRFGS